MVAAGFQAGLGLLMHSTSGVTDHAKVAQAFGVKSWTVEDPLQLGAVLKEEAEAPVSEWVA